MPQLYRPFGNVGDYCDQPDRTISQYRPGIDVRTGCSSAEIGMAPSPC